MLSYWDQLTASELDSLGSAVAILPVAATEQHGPHLPTGTDAFILRGILRAVADRAGSTVRGIVLPLQAIGWSSEHESFAGTLSLDAELLGRAWAGLGPGLERNGLKRLLILNSHGGNPPAIALAAMRLRTRHGMLVVQTHWEKLARPAELAPPGAPARDWHAGWIETSVMLHLHPELVALDKAEIGGAQAMADFAPDETNPWAWLSADLSSNGVIGDPRLASAELGKHLVERAAIGLKALIEEIARAPWG